MLQQEVPQVLQQEVPELLQSPLHARQVTVCRALCGSGMAPVSSSLVVVLPTSVGAGVVGAAVG